MEPRKQERKSYHEHAQHNTTLSSAPTNNNSKRNKRKFIALFLEKDRSKRTVSSEAILYRRST